MINSRQIKKPNVLRCRTDKTRCRVKCPKCLKSTGFSKLFISPENLWRHLYQSHSFDKNYEPSISHVIEVLEKISIALKEKKSLEIAESIEIGMIVK